MTIKTKKRGRARLPENIKRKARAYYLTDSEREKMDTYFNKIRGK